MPLELLWALFWLNATAGLGLSPGGNIAELSALPLIGNKLHAFWTDHHEMIHAEIMRRLKASIDEDEDEADAEEEEFADLLTGETLLEVAGEFVF